MNETNEAHDIARWDLETDAARLGLTQRELLSRRVAPLGARIASGFESQFGESRVRNFATKVFHLARIVYISVRD